MLKRRAFTLIELLVVIVVIAILATLAVIALQQSRRNARDAKRVGDIKQMQTALELYYNEVGSYPELASITANNSIEHNGVVYMAIFPSAPSPADGPCNSDSNKYEYQTRGIANSSYNIKFCLGSSFDQFSGGLKCASPRGITNNSCFICGQDYLYDVDSNLYETVSIGTQCWMSSNLRTTKYKDNSSIDYPGTDNTSWQGNTSGAYSWYNNDETAYKSIYGALYNFHAVANSRGLCPDGWHVPSDPEIDAMISYVVNNNIDASTTNVARWLKSCRKSSSPHCQYCSNGGACNVSSHPRWNANATHYGIDFYSLNILPAGFRMDNGSFAQMGNYFDFWTSTELAPTHARDRYILSSGSNINSYSAPKNRGFSVRCIKD